MLTVEDIVAAQKANADKLFGLAQNGFAYAETLAALNVRTSKTAMTASSRYMLALLDIKTPQESLQLHAGLVQPLAEQGKAYGQEVQSAATALTVQWGQCVQTLNADAQKQFQTALNSNMEHTPAGGEAATNAMKNWVATSMAAMEAMQKAAQQATQMTQTQVAALTKSASATAA